LAALALLIVADDQVAGQEIDLLPVIVHEGRDGVDAWREAQEPRAASHLARLVEVAGENLLLDAGRVAGRCDPAVSYVDGMKFQVRLVHRHAALPDRFVALSTGLSPPAIEHPLGLARSLPVIPCPKTHGRGLDTCASTPTCMFIRNI